MSPLNALFMDRNNPFITIILPVYNGEKTLKETLESLLTQTYSNFEILIGIDGTKDGSKAIAESFNDRRINIFENETNLGLGPNLNKLISLASNDSTFIAMAEQDDIYAKERLQWQIDVFQEHPDVGLVSGIVEFKNENSNVLFPGILIRGEQFPQGKALFEYLYVNQLKVVNTCMMIRKQVHLDEGLSFTDKYPNMNIDWDYVLRFSLISQIHGIPKKLAMMNRGSHRNSVTINKKLQHQTSRRLLLDMKQEFPELVTDKLYSEALKMHRKIELGHRSKHGIIFFSLYYFILYFDFYFLKYLNMRLSKYLNK